ncbi:MAG: hypothetical protein H8E21_17200 [Gammaproteobacteria bacterium]|nr:hypothetical protein [Gammaproteobacteria bacterium]MBL6999192.1 hypothetical protein [Gammaproteobacteria bacterium]
MTVSSFNKNSPLQTVTPITNRDPDPLLFRQMRSALQEFVDRVEKGEITSKYHYRKFKQLLSE